MEPFMKPVKIFAFIFPLAIFNTILCQETWISRNAHHIVASGNMLLLVSGGTMYEYLASKIYKIRTLDDSDPCRQFCIDQIAAVGVPDPSTVTVKATSERRKGNARSKIRELNISDRDYDSFINKSDDFDKEAFGFLIRHEGSHLKNNDCVKGRLFYLVSFNSLLYGTAFLAKLAEYSTYMPTNPTLKSLLKTWAPIAIALTVTRFITNLYGSTYERRADKDAATDLSLANGGVRKVERWRFEYETNPENQRSWFVSFLMKNAVLHRCIIGYEQYDIRLQRLRDYATAFEKRES